MATHTAVAPLVVEYTTLSVSGPYTPVPSGAKAPPQTSTTFSPPTWTHTPAPTSPPEARLAARASRTGWKPGPTAPPTSGIIDDAAQLLHRLHRLGADGVDAQHRHAGFL